MNVLELLGWSSLGRSGRIKPSGGSTHHLPSASHKKSSFARRVGLRLRRPQRLESTVQGWLRDPSESFSLNRATSNSLERGIATWRAAVKGDDLGTFFLDEKAFEGVFGAAAEGIAAFGIAGDLDLANGEKHPLRLLLIRTACETYSRTIRDTRYVRGTVWLSENCLFVLSSREGFAPGSPELASFKTLSGVLSAVGVFRLTTPGNFVQALSEFIRIHLSSYSWVHDCSSIQTGPLGEQPENFAEIVA